MTEITELSKAPPEGPSASPGGRLRNGQLSTGTGKAGQVRRATPGSLLLGFSLWETESRDRDIWPFESTETSSALTGTERLPAEWPCCQMDSTTVSLLRFGACRVHWHLLGPAGSPVEAAE